MYFKGLPDPSKTFFIVLVRKRTEGEAKGHLNLWDNYARKTISNETRWCT